MTLREAFRICCLWSDDIIYAIQLLPISMHKGLFLWSRTITIWSYLSSLIKRFLLYTSYEWLLYWTHFWKHLANSWVSSQDSSRPHIATHTWFCMGFANNRHFSPIIVVPDQTGSLVLLSMFCAVLCLQKRANQLVKSGWFATYIVKPDSFIVRWCCFIQACYITTPWPVTDYTYMGYGQGPDTIIISW